MTFEVDFSLPGLEVPDRETQIAFHAMNKSGSEAVSNALHQAFVAAGQERRFFSHFRMPIDQAAFVELVDRHRGGGFFIDHYLYGWIKPRPNRVMLTQFRHPLPRILSAYNWLKRIHEKRSGTEYFSLIDFVRHTEGKIHCIVIQLGLNWKGIDTVPWLDRIARLTARDMYELSLEALDREIYAVGIAEYFEESLFLYARLCGLSQLQPWIRDVRNPGRMHSSEVDAETLAVIEEVLKYDYLLYEQALQRFRRQFEGAQFGPSLQAYKQACVAQYNDRIL